MQRKLFLIWLTCLMSVAVFAQEEVPAETVFNGFSKGADGWFVDLQLGGNILFNQDIKEVEAANGLRLNTSLSVGKWIMPYWGLRLQAKSMWWKGAASADNIAAWELDPSQLTIYKDGSASYNVFYLNPHLDFMLSLASCAKGGWTDSQKWDVIPFIGLGFMHAFEANGFKGGNCLTGNFGLQGKYRINPNWDVNLELAASVMPNYYEQVAGPVKQADFAFAVGATYNIGGHKFGERSKKNNAPVSSSSSRAASDTVFVYKTTETIIERAAPVSDADLSASAKKGAFDQPFQIALIEFSVGSDQPKQDYEVQYYNVAAFISAYPDATLRLDAYCDAATGTQEYNDELAKRRAETVRKILADDYGVDNSKITLNPLGSREQVYERTSLNRIVRITVIPK